MLVELNAIKKFQTICGICKGPLRFLMQLIYNKDELIQATLVLYAQK